MNIDYHHDGHGLNERISVRSADGVGAGGAHHRYKFAIDVSGTQRAMDAGCTGAAEEAVGFIQFQHGPPGKEGSTPGVTSQAVVAMLIAHFEQFQTGEFRCRENALVITKLEEALHWMKHRADARARRGVLGTHEK